MGADIHQADILSWAASYDGPPFHAALMDAPYEISFMGRAWDASGVAFQAATWRAIAQHLLPGAFLFVFAGTVNDDLISVAMREAGLRKHHKMLSWSYGSGLQKSTRMDDKLDRRAGATREVLRTRKHAPKFAAAEFGYREKDNGYNSRTRQTFDETAPATGMAQTWAGHRYGLQHLKPAIEPILVFQKPYAGGDALTSITTTGAGAINVDGGRIATDEVVTAQHEAYKGRGGVYGEYGSTLRHNGSETSSVIGRWPASLALSHHPACNGVCHEDCTVRRLGAQSGESQGNGPSVKRKRSDGDFWKQGGGGFVTGGDTLNIGDSGTAARYFFNADWMYERMELADQIGYYAKCSPGEREAGLDPMQAALMAALAGDEAGDDFPETTVDDGRKTPIDNPFLRGETTRRNTHTTLKPLALTRWLATLLLPPDAYAPRRLLVPFAGAASEMIGAMLAGWDEITGVELMPEHVAIARARLAYWRQRAHAFSDGRPITVKTAAAAPTAQRSLFDGPSEAA